MSRGYQPDPPRIPRPVTATNFDEWCADPRSLTFEEYMAEAVPADRGWRPPAPPAPPLRSIRL